MLTKDFDTEFAQDAPAEFTLCGQTFHAKAHVPYAMWRTLMKGDSRVSDDMSPEDVDRLLFGDLLDPADIDRFMQLLNSAPNGKSPNGKTASTRAATAKAAQPEVPSPNRAQVLAVYAWLMDVASGKARSNAETSSAG